MENAFMEGIKMDLEGLARGEPLLLGAQAEDVSDGIPHVIAILIVHKLEVAKCF